MLLALVPLVFGVMVLLTARRMGGARRTEAARRAGQGAHAEALRAGDFAAAAALAETHYGPQSAELATALLALSETAPPEEALPALRRALAILSARQAPPETRAAPLARLAALSPDADEAYAAITQSLAQTRRAFGKSAPEFAARTAQAARLFAAQDRAPEAEAQFRAALALATGPEAVTLRADFATFLAARGRTREAEALRAAP